VRTVPALELTPASLPAPSERKLTSNSIALLVGLTLVIVALRLRRT
jgi:hypothetical protein